VIFEGSPPLSSQDNGGIPQGPFVLRYIPQDLVSLSLFDLWTSYRIGLVWLLPTNREAVSSESQFSMALCFLRALILSFLPLVLLDIEVWPSTSCHVPVFMTAPFLFGLDFIGYVLLKDFDHPHGPIIFSTQVTFFLPYLPPVLFAFMGYPLLLTAMGGAPPRSSPTLGITLSSRRVFFPLTIAIVT